MVRKIVIVVAMGGGVVMSSSAGRAGGSQREEHFLEEQEPIGENQGSRFLNREALPRDGATDPRDGCFGCREVSSGEIT